VTGLIPNIGVGQFDLAEGTDCVPGAWCRRPTFSETVDQVRGAAGNAISMSCSVKVATKIQQPSAAIILSLISPKRASVRRITKLVSGKGDCKRQVCVGAARGPAARPYGPSVGIHPTAHAGLVALRVGQDPPRGRVLVGDQASARADRCRDARLGLIVRHVDIHVNAIALRAR